MPIGKLIHTVCIIHYTHDYLAAKRRRDIAVVRKKIFSGTNLREYALCGLGIHSDTCISIGHVLLLKRILIIVRYREMILLKALKFVFEFFHPEDRPEGMNLRDKPILSLVYSI